MGKKYKFNDDCSHGICMGCWCACHTPPTPRSKALKNIGELILGVGIVVTIITVIIYGITYIITSAVHAAWH